MYWFWHLSNRRTDDDDGNDDEKKDDGGEFGYLMFDQLTVTMTVDCCRRNLFSLHFETSFLGNGWIWEVAIPSIKIKCISRNYNFYKFTKCASWNVTRNFWLLHFKRHLLLHRRLIRRLSRYDHCALNWQNNHFYCSRCMCANLCLCVAQRHFDLHRNRKGDRIGIHKCRRSTIGAARKIFYQIGAKLCC